MANDTKKLSNVFKALDGMCWDESETYLTESEKLKRAEELQNVLSATSALAGKWCLADNISISLYGSAIRGEKLTRIEVIRQMLNASTEPEAFAAALRRLADKLWKSPNVCGAEALG